MIVSLTAVAAAIGYFAYLYGVFVSNHMPSDMMQVSVTGPILATVLYGSMIVLGTRFMASRAPLTLKTPMVVYNVTQAVLNMVAGCALVYYHVSKHGTAVWGSPMDMSASGFHLSFFIWVHYSNKYAELLDTVFMVFRKKDSQVSFLHVYHHILLLWSWWVVCKVAPGGGCYFGAAVNSFIHVIMYSYYGMTLLGFKCFFKNYITLAQMVQFVLCASQSISAFLGNTGGVPIGLAVLQLFVAVNMLVLFGHFYRKTYVVAARTTNRHSE